MSHDKYGRSVPLLCPTCGGSQFGYDDGADEVKGIVKCASCGREMTKDDLIQENRENVSEHLNEIGNQIVSDTALKMRESLRKSLRGNKSIKIK